MTSYAAEERDRANVFARGRAWLNEIVSGTARVEDIAARQRCSVRHVKMTISMAFIAPDLVKAAIEGRLRGKICDCVVADAVVVEPVSTGQIPS